MFARPGPKSPANPNRRKGMSSAQVDLNFQPPHAAVTLQLALHAGAAVTVRILPQWDAK